MITLFKKVSNRMKSKKYKSEDLNNVLKSRTGRLDTLKCFSVSVPRLIKIIREAFPFLISK